MTAFQEQLFGNWRDGNERRRVRHALSILAWAEDGKSIFGCAESFDAFIRLLAVVEPGSHAVDGEVRRANEGRRRPLGGFDAVVGFDMAVHLGKGSM